jgi:hypothetical protein
MIWTERQRWALYAAIVAALETGHPRRAEVARALERLPGRITFLSMHNAVIESPEGP